MQGRREPSFFFTKKNPAPAGEEEGRMRPAFKDSLIYLSMASLSGPDREYKRPLGGEVPGRRSMAQSYGRWGGKDVARDLLKTRQRSWYSAGTPERSADSTWNTEDKQPVDPASPWLWGVDVPPAWAPGQLQRVKRQGQNWEPPRPMSRRVEQSTADGDAEDAPPHAEPVPQGSQNHEAARE